MPTYGCYVNCSLYSESNYVTEKSSSVNHRGQKRKQRYYTSSCMQRLRRPRKPSVKTASVMSEIRIGNLLEASEKHEAEMIFTYISKSITHLWHHYRKTL